MAEGGTDFCPAHIALHCTDAAGFFGARSGHSRVICVPHPVAGRTRRSAVLGIQAQILEKAEESGLVDQGRIDPPRRERLEDHDAAGPSDEAGPGKAGGKANTVVPDIYLASGRTSCDVVRVTRGDQSCRLVA